MRPRLAPLTLLLLSSACITRVIDNGDGTTHLSVGDDGDHTTSTTASDPTTPGPTSDTEIPTTDPSAGPSTDPSTDPTGGITTEPGNDSELCTKFGHFPGIQDMIDSFLGKVLVDERINAYFLTSDLDAANLRDCLAAQIGELTGCESVLYTCQDMKTAHAGMGISNNDFSDLFEDFVAALDEIPTLTPDDKEPVLTVLASMAPDIIEDPDSNITIYQRLGRKPGVAQIIGSPEDPQSFVALVAADATLLPFFATSDLARLNTCLVRQLTSATSGPNIYGKEVTAPSPADLGVTIDNPCRDMVSSHQDLKDDKNTGIELADFGALVGHLITAMTNFGVPMDDQNAIVGTLGPLCSSIVTVDPNQCP